MQNRGQLWVIDGVDGVGKATQTDLLVKRLSSLSRFRSHPIHQVSFPHYDEKPWGHLIRQYLDGQFGPLETVGPYPASLLYAADRGYHAEQLEGWLSNGEWVVCDRYTPSNAAFQAAKIRNEDEKQQYTQWLFRVEHELFRIPKPAGVIIMYLSTDISQKRTEERRKVAQSLSQEMNGKVSHTDIHEQNAQYLSAVSNEYLRMAKQFSWYLVECNEGSRELSREEVAEKIWRIIEKHVQ